jgi:hypothetical protein
VHEVSQDIYLKIKIFFLFIKDPFIDDNVEFARRLSALKVPHHLTVFDGWPHGYLDFGFASNDIAQLNIKIIDLLQNIVRQSYSDNTGDVASVPTFTN